MFCAYVGITNQNQTYVWFQKYGFVIEDLTGYIFAKVLIYIPLKASCLFYIFFSVFVETEICAQYKYQVIGQRTNIGC